MGEQSSAASSCGVQGCAGKAGKQCRQHLWGSSGCQELSFSNRSRRCEGTPAEHPASRPSSCRPSPVSVWPRGSRPAATSPAEALAAAGRAWRRTASWRGVWSGPAAGSKGSVPLHHSSSGRRAPSLVPQATAGAWYGGSSRGSRPPPTHLLLQRQQLLLLRLLLRLLLLPRSLLLLLLPLDHLQGLLQGFGRRSVTASQLAQLASWQQGLRGGGVALQEGSRQRGVGRCCCACCAIA